jgi:hypothetical protein
VTFLREPPVARFPLPAEKNGARILAMQGLEIFTAYTPVPAQPGVHGPAGKDLRREDHHPYLGYG